MLALASVLKYCNSRTSLSCRHVCTLKIGGWQGAPDCSAAPWCNGTVLSSGVCFFRRTWLYRGAWESRDLVEGIGGWCGWPCSGRSGVAATRGACCVGDWQEASPGDGGPVERRGGDIACRELALWRHGEARELPGLATSCAAAKAGTYQL